MPYMLYEEFAITYFTPNSAPTRCSFNRYCVKRQLPARKIGDRWYVDSEQFEANGNDIVAKVLRDVRRAA